MNFKFPHKKKQPVLCCAVLCCAVLCCAVLCCAVLKHISSIHSCQVLSNTNLLFLLCHFKHDAIFDIILPFFRILVNFMPMFQKCLLPLHPPTWRHLQLGSLTLRFKPLFLYAPYQSRFRLIFLSIFLNLYVLLCAPCRVTDLINLFSFDNNHSILAGVNSVIIFNAYFNTCWASARVIV